MLRAAVLALRWTCHGHRDTPEFRNEIRKSLKPEPQAAGRR